MASVENIANIGIRLSIQTDKPNTAPIANATKQVEQLAVAQQRSSVVGMNFNRVIQDSPYFLTSFNMGVMSISNNIGPLAESFAVARQQGQSFGAVMKGMFTGMGGWLTVLNLVVAGVQAVTMWMASEERETNKSKEAADKKKKSMEALEKATSDYRKELDKVITSQGRLTVSFEDDKEIKDAYIKSVRLRNQYNKEIADIKAGAYDEEVKIAKAEMQKIQAEIKASGGKASQEQINRMKVLRDITKKTSDDRVASLQILADKQSEMTEKLTAEYKSLVDNQTAYKDAVEVGLETTQKSTKADKDKNQALEEQKNKTAELKKQYEILLDLYEFGNKVNIEPFKMTASNIRRMSEAAEKERERIFKERMIFTDKEMRRLTSPLNAPERPMEQLEQESFNLDYSKAFASASAQTFESEMSRAWRNIFGEANSLFEVFVSNFVNSLVSQMAAGLASIMTGSGGGGGGFSVFGLIGSALGLFTGGVGGGSEPIGGIGGTGAVPSGRGGGAIVLNIDGKAFMKAVVEPNFKQSQSNMIRTRQL